MAKVILVCIGCIMELDILVIIIKFYSVKYDHTGVGILMTCNCCYFCVGYICDIAKLVCIIILLANFYKGTTTGEFLDWYENCNIIEPYKTGLKGAYKTLDEVYSYMIALIILTVAQLTFNWIGNSILGKTLIKQRN